MENVNMEYYEKEDKAVIREAMFKFALEYCNMMERAKVMGNPYAIIDNMQIRANEIVDEVYKQIVEI